MPYINRTDRHKYQDLLSKISHYVSKNIEEDILILNLFTEIMIIEAKRNLKYSYLYYIITDLIEEVWGPVEKRRYSDHQNISGFLYCACLEYHRRYVKKEYEHNGSTEYPDLFLMSFTNGMSGYLTELGKLVPKDHMAISGNMNYITSYLIDEIWGVVEDRTPEDHLFIEYLLENKANGYYDTFTAPYEDKKILEQGDLRDL